MLGAEHILRIKLMIEMEFNVHAADPDFCKNVKNFLEDTEHGLYALNNFPVIYYGVNYPAKVLAGLSNQDVHNASLFFKATLLSFLLKQSLQAEDKVWIKNTRAAIESDYQHPATPDLRIKTKPLFGYENNINIFLVLLVLQLLHEAYKYYADKEEYGKNNYVAKAPEDILNFIILASMLPSLGLLVYKNYKINRNRFFGPPRCKELEELLDHLAEEIEEANLTENTSKILSS